MSIDRTVDTLAARKAGFPKTTGSLQPMPNRCGAQLTFTGTSPANPPRYCMQWPAKGRQRCKRNHNGTAAVGADVPSFKTGLYSKYDVLSPRVFAQFQTSLADAQLLDLKPDVALLDTLLWQAAANIGQGASAAQWQAVADFFSALGAQMDRLPSAHDGADAVPPVRETEHEPEQH